MTATRDADQHPAQGRSDVIDVARPQTWPTALRDLIDVLSAATPTAHYASDLEPPDDAEDHVRTLLAGRHLRAYHATRLLDHERDMIAAQGLRPFSQDLFDDRINVAHTHTAISAAEHRELLGAHMYATGEQHSRGRRENQVCLVLSDHVFEDSPSAVEPLLSTWGGEGIYFSARGITLEAFLRRLGRPTIIMVAVSVLPNRANQSCFPDLARVLIGAVRGLRIEADLFHPQAITADAVMDFWQPGDLPYDRYTRLPRS